MTLSELVDSAVAHAPDWREQHDTLVTVSRSIIAGLERELAIAREHIIELEQEKGGVEIWLENAKADIQDHLARNATLNNQLQAAQEDHNALVDLVTEFSAYLRDYWESDEQANRVKAALAAHDAKYGRPEE